MKIWEVEFDYNGEKETHIFWESSNSSIEKFIEAMTKKGDLVFVEKKLVKTI